MVEVVDGVVDLISHALLTECPRTRTFNFQTFGKIHAIHQNFINFNSAPAPTLKLPETLLEMDLMKASADCSIS